MTFSNWHPEDVKCALRKTGMSLSEAARQAGLSASAGINCLQYPVPAANRAIAERLGLPVQEIWPEWFDDRGERIVRFRKRSTAPAARQRQKGAAA